MARLQQDFKNLLLSDPALAVVPVHTFKQFVMEAVQDANLSVWHDRSGEGKVGAAIEVRMPACSVRHPNVPGPQLVVEIVVRVMEDPQQNTTGLTCEAIALEVLSWLDGIVLQSGGGGDLAFYPDARGKTMLPNYDYPDRFCYDCTFVAQWAQSAAARAQCPLATADQFGAVTLGDTTDGGVIYFTLDGSAPVAPVQTGPAAPPPVAPTQLCTGAISAPVGTTIRWLAVLPGCLPSPVGKYIVPNP